LLDAHWQRTQRSFDSSSSSNVWHCMEMSSFVENLQPFCWRSTSTMRGNGQILRFVSLLSSRKSETWRAHFHLSWERWKLELFKLDLEDFQFGMWHRTRSSMHWLCILDKIEMQFAMRMWSSSLGNTARENLTFFSATGASDCPSSVILRDLAVAFVKHSLTRGWRVFLIS
jgi:hypothetical protein